MLWRDAQTVGKIHHRTLPAILLLDERIELIERLLVARALKLAVGIPLFAHRKHLVEDAQQQAVKLALAVVAVHSGYLVPNEFIELIEAFCLIGHQLNHRALPEIHQDGQHRRDVGQQFLGYTVAEQHHHATEIVAETISMNNGVGHQGHQLVAAYPVLMQIHFHRSRTLQTHGKQWPAQLPRQPLKSNHIKVIKQYDIIVVAAHMLSLRQI